MSAVSQKADTICRGCDQAFYSLDQLMHHRLTCCPGIDTASTDQLFGCRICGLVTNRLFMVKRHCRESHGDDSDLLLVATLHQRPDVQLLALPVSVQTAASVASAPVASEPVASATAAAAAAALTVQSQPDIQQSVSQPSKKRLRASSSPSVSQSSVEARPAKRQSLSTAEAGSSKRSSISSEKNARSSNSRTRKAASRAAVRHSLPATASKKAKSRKSLNSAKLLESQNSVALKTEQKSVCASSAASAAAVAKKTRTRAAAVAAAVATTAAILNGGRHNGRHASLHNPSEQKSASSPAAAPASSAASSGSKSKTQSNSKPGSKPAPRICVSHEIFSAMSAASGNVRVRLGRLPQAVLDQLHRNGKFVLPAGSGADDFATDAARTCSSTSTSAEEQQAQQQMLVDQLPPAPVVEPPPEPVMSPLLPVSMVGAEPLRLPDTSQPPINGVSIDGDGNCGRDGELVDDDERDDTDKSQATATEEMHSEAVGLQLVTVPLEAL
ncbi:hypothetical protein BOX15_Mlig011972g1 [Macrostomum lignano]|uniref:Uncharacterized protein n=1 Tax=Macrostomum lignano TaxID=282301 RepID=A0A267DQ36_9PLAT|nr:hypothetical protein BOX15_Mlig011972g1 [Macrostomum lignano]